MLRRPPVSVLLALPVLLLPASLAAQESPLQLGQRLFAEGKTSLHEPPKARALFSKAADAFAQQASASPSADIYHDLGNACLLANRLPEAILAYHRGRALSPDDARLRRNLEYARSLVGYGLSERGKPQADRGPYWLPHWRTLLAWGVWAAYALTLLFFTLALTDGGLRHYLWMGLCLIACLAQGWYLLATQETRPLVVVAENDVPLRQGNGPSYPPTPELPALARGMEARLVHRRGDWLLLETPTGERGWVPRTGVLLDAGG